MTIVMGRILAQREKSILVEAYGVYEDYYDESNTDNQGWIPKREVKTINDEYVEGDDFTKFQLTGQILEILVKDSIADKLLN